MSRRDVQPAQSGTVANQDLILIVVLTSHFNNRQARCESRRDNIGVVSKTSHQCRTAGSREEIGKGTAIKLADVTGRFDKMRIFRTPCAGIRNVLHHRIRERRADQTQVKLDAKTVEREIERIAVSGTGLNRRSAVGIDINSRARTPRCIDHVVVRREDRRVARSTDQGIGPRSTDEVRRKRRRELAGIQDVSLLGTGNDRDGNHSRRNQILVRHRHVSITRDDKRAEIGTRTIFVNDVQSDDMVSRGNRCDIKSSQRWCNSVTRGQRRSIKRPLITERINDAGVIDIDLNRCGGCRSRRMNDDLSYGGCNIQNGEWLCGETRCAPILVGHCRRNRRGIVNIFVDGLEKSCFVDRHGRCRSVPPGDRHHRLIIQAWIVDRSLSKDRIAFVNGPSQWIAEFIRKADPTDKDRSDVGNNSLGIRRSKPTRFRIAGTTRCKHRRIAGTRRCVVNVSM